MNIFGMFNRHGRPNRFISGRTHGYDVWLNDAIYFDDNDVLRCSPSYDIEDHLDDLNMILSTYMTMVGETYHQKMRYYKGDHKDIQDKPIKDELGDDKNRVVVSVAKNLVNTFNGYFIGVPPKITYAPTDDGKTQAKKVNDVISQALSVSDSDDVFYEWSKSSDIYGRGYLVAYIANDDNKTLKFSQKGPENALIVYSNRNDSDPIFAVTFDYVDGRYFGSVYTPAHIYQFDNSDMVRHWHPFSSSQQFIDRVDAHDGVVANPFGMIPVIELPENNERLGLYDDLISLIDHQDQVLSALMDDISYFSNAIMVTKGVAPLNDKDKQDIKHWRVMQIQNDGGSEDASVEFLDKPNSNELQENALKHLSDNIYDGAQVVNLSDPALSSSASGKALEQKMQPMTMLASTKAEKMRTAIKRLLTIILNQNGGFGNQDDIAELVRQIKIEFTPNIPHSDIDEATVVKNLNGIISKPALLSYLSRINNVDDEIKREEQEKEQNAQKFNSAGPTDGSPDDSNGDKDDQSPGAKDDDAPPSIKGGDDK
ncbi:phage portal protein [Lactiplantibacillus paraxiangfangensis]|uniref:phage portal protein n=1 Tax=Lactiplantibacillus paraxiangfangensis TaxID=3076224 RepID=UPI0030C6C081